MNEGQRIRKARELAELTQAELAAKVGVSMRTIGNWERGATVPRNRRAVLEEVLGLDDRRGHFNGMRVKSDEDDLFLLKDLLRALEWASSSAEESGDREPDEEARQKLIQMRKRAGDKKVPASAVYEVFEELIQSRGKQGDREGEHHDEAQEPRTQTGSQVDSGTGSGPGDEGAPIGESTMTERVAAIEEEIRSLPGATGEALITHLRDTAAKWDRDHTDEGRGDVPNRGA